MQNRNGNYFSLQKMEKSKHREKMQTGDKSCQGSKLIQLCAPGIPEITFTTSQTGKAQPLPRTLLFSAWLAQPQRQPGQTHGGSSGPEPLLMHKPKVIRHGISMGKHLSNLSMQEEEAESIQQEVRMHL